MSFNFFSISRCLLIAVPAWLAGSRSLAQNISAEENFAINRPGIVKVQAEFSATVYVNKVEMNERSFDKLVDSVKRLDTSGRLLNASQKLDMLLDALNKNPLRFFNTTDDYFRQRHHIVASGTGFFISGTGYVVTNCHVIDRDSAFIRRKFLLSTFQAVTESNINALQSSWGMLLNNEQRNVLYNTYASLYTALSSPILIDLDKELYVLYRGDIENAEPDIIKKPAKLISKGESIPGKDIAIIKINGNGNLPVLSLAKDSLPPVGSQVLVYGYPEPVSSNSFLAAETGIEPTLTTGIVSAVKKTVQGWPAIQVDAMMSHGNSGGPVCNERGEVIAVIAFGSIENSTGGLASGFNFAIPVSVLNEFINTAKIKPGLSESSELFNDAIRLYYKGFYRKSLGKLTDVQEVNSDYPQLYAYMKQCKEKIAAGADKESLFLKYSLIGLIFLGLLLLYFYWRRKEIKNPA